MAPLIKYCIGFGEFQAKFFDVERPPAPCWSRMTQRFFTMVDKSLLSHNFNLKLLSILAFKI